MSKGGKEDITQQNVVKLPGLYKAPMLCAKNGVSRNIYVPAMNSNSFNAASNSKKLSHLPIAPKPPPKPPPQPPPKPPPKQNLYH